MPRHSTIHCCCRMSRHLQAGSVATELAASDAAKLLSSRPVAWLLLDAQRYCSIHTGRLTIDGLVSRKSFTTDH